MQTISLSVLALCAGSLTLSGPGGDPVRFAKPRLIKAGEQNLGEGRLYPSPAIHDVDGDGTPDLVIGDLFGRVTYAPGTRGKAGLQFGDERPLKDRRGEQLKFHNW